MRVNVDYIETAPAPVVVRRDPTSRVIDKLRKLDDRTFNRSVKAAKVLRVLDKGIRWIEKRFYDR